VECDTWGDDLCAGLDGSLLERVIEDDASRFDACVALALGALPLLGLDTLPMNITIKVIRFCCLY